MKLTRIDPGLELQPYIHNFWVFENEMGLPAEDSRVIAPNGRAKFIYPFANGLSTVENGIRTDYPEGEPLLIGIWDKPVVLTSPPGSTGTIGIELTPNGLHRFTHFPAHEIKNRIFTFSAVYGPGTAELTQRLAEAALPEKIALFRAFLLRQLFSLNRHNAVIDHSVALIANSRGRLSLDEISGQTGYSRRYIDMLFKENLGISPKALSGITRFQSFYTLWANAPQPGFYTEEMWDAYYDQAHFIKEFKRFTGYSPRQYAVQRNEFGRIFYKK